MNIFLHASLKSLLNLHFVSNFHETTCKSKPRTSSTRYNHKSIQKTNQNLKSFKTVKKTWFLGHFLSDFDEFSCKKMWNASRFCVSSLCRGHANLLCIVPILVYVHPKVDKVAYSRKVYIVGKWTWFVCKVSSFTTCYALEILVFYSTSQITDSAGHYQSIDAWLGNLKVDS